MNIFDLGLYELKDIGNSRVVCFLEHILDAVMKHAPVGFLCILGIQNMIGSVFFPFLQLLNPNV